MCWSGEVSLGFALLGFACAAFLLFAGTVADASKPPAHLRSRALLHKHYKSSAKWHALIVANIAAVELCECAVWFSGPAAWHGDTQQPCPLVNVIATHALFVFGFMNWVWIMPLWGLKSTDGDRARFEPLVVVGIIAAIGFTARIVLGDLSFAADAPSAQAALGVDFWESTLHFAYNESLPISTCSFRTLGAHPHLYWRFATSEQPWLPNGFLWLIVAILPLLCYQPRDLAAVLSLWGIGTYMLPTFLLTPGEAMSLYCWLGFGFEFIFLLEPVVRWMCRNWVGSPSLYLPMSFEPAQDVRAKHVQA